jgi:hypothetical protein
MISTISMLSITTTYNTSTTCPLRRRHPVSHTYHTNINTLCCNTNAYNATVILIPYLRLSRHILKGEFVSLLPFRGRIPVIINKLPPLVKISSLPVAPQKPGSRHTCRMHYARTGYSTVCTIVCTIVHWTVHLMRILRVQQLQISHQAYNNPDLKKLKNSSAHTIKTDHLVQQQYFFFSVLAEGDARMHAQISNTTRSALRARDHSTAFVHTHRVQHLQARDVSNHIPRVQLHEHATIPMRSPQASIPIACKHFKRANLSHCVLPYRRADPMGFYLD